MHCNHYYRHWKLTVFLKLLFPIPLSKKISKLLNDAAARNHQERLQHSVTLTARKTKLSLVQNPLLVLLSSAWGKKVAWIPKTSPKVMQQSNCYPENFTTAKWPKNQNLTQCILFPRFCSPTIPKRGLHRLDCTSFEQKEWEKFQSCSSLHALYLRHPKSSPLKNPPGFTWGFFGNGIPIPACWKTCNINAIGRFLNQVILT